MTLFGRRATVVVMIAIGLACMPSRGQSESNADPGAAANNTQPQLIDHLTPRRDSTGPAPTRFEWTAATGADEYAIGLWNEADTMVWRQAGLSATSVPFPKDYPLEPGTYYWSVTGLRGGEPIAHSGLSAFVVLR
jgi:hypothetical protein